VPAAARLPSAKIAPVSSNTAPRLVAVSSIALATDSSCTGSPDLERRIPAQPRENRQRYLSPAAPDRLPRLLGQAFGFLSVWQSYVPAPDMDFRPGP